MHLGKLRLPVNSWAGSFPSPSASNAERWSPLEARSGTSTCLNGYSPQSSAAEECGRPLDNIQAPVTAVVRREAFGLAQVNVILKVGSLEEMNKPVLPTQISQCEQDS